MEKGENEREKLMIFEEILFNIKKICGEFNIFTRFNKKLSK